MSDAVYRHLVDLAPVALFVCRPDGRLVSCNAAFARLLGFTSVEEALATDLSSLAASPDLEQKFFHALRVRRRLERVPGRLRARDGRLLHVIVSAEGEFDESGALVEACGVLVDFTARAERDAAAQARDARFRTVFANSYDPMFILDDGRRIRDANHAAGSLLGLTPSELAGMRLDALLLDDHAGLEETWADFLAVGEARRECRLVSSTHGHRLVEASFRAAAHGDRHLCIARDITDRRVLEERLVQSEKIESVGRLAGGIAHDFNNLLTAILGYTELLLGNRVPGDPERADLVEIQKAGQRAAALTQQLLAYSRKQVLLPKDVDLNETVSGLHGMLTRLIREDIVLSTSLAPRPALIRIDPTQLEQVILNLVLNSRDALPHGGQIRLEVAHVAAGDVDLSPDTGIQADEFVRLRVIDDGVGIPPEVRAHLFEPFFTTKQVGQGTGLGLASVYGIVRQSNGVIAVESDPGRGATFTMHFPGVGAQPAAPAATELPRAVQGPPDQGTILLVEDEDAVRIISSAALRRQGYRVLEAATPRLAGELFDQYQDEIDLLVTDVVMPEMNGPALAQRLIGIKADLRVLFISGYADLSLPVEKQGGHASFLRKPFRASDLAAKVREALGRGRVTA